MYCCLVTLFKDIKKSSMDEENRLFIQSSFPHIINQKKMEPTFPLFYYYVPNLMYSGFPVAVNRVENFENLSPISTQINFYNDQNWLGFCCPQKQISSQASPHFKPIPIKTPQEEIQLENSQQELKDSVKNKIAKKKKLDKAEYVPNQKIEDKKSNTAYLNEFRNILPNTIHQILSYIQRKNKSKTIITKLIQKFEAERKVVKIQDESSNDCSNFELSVARFYAYQNHLKNKLSNYVTLQTFKTLCTDENIQHDSEIFSIEEQKIYNKICRIVILYYLKYEVVCVLMSSKRMQKNKKWEHLKVNRRIQAYIRSGFKAECE